MSSSYFLHRLEQRLNHAVSITLGQQFVHSRHNPGREGVNKGSGTGQPSLRTSLRTFVIMAAAPEATMRPCECPYTLTGCLPRLPRYPPQRRRPDTPAPGGTPERHRWHPGLDGRVHEPLGTAPGRAATGAIACGRRTPRGPAQAAARTHSSSTRSGCHPATRRWS